MTATLPHITAIVDGLSDLRECDDERVQRALSAVDALVKEHRYVFHCLTVATRPTI